MNLEEASKKVRELGEQYRLSRVESTLIAIGVDRTAYQVRVVIMEDHPGRPDWGLVYDGEGPSLEEALAVATGIVKERT